MSLQVFHYFSMDAGEVAFLESLIWNKEKEKLPSLRLHGCKSELEKETFTDSANKEKLFTWVFVLYWNGKAKGLANLRTLFCFR